MQVFEPFFVQQVEQHLGIPLPEADNLAPHLKQVLLFLHLLHNTELAPVLVFIPHLIQFSSHPLQTLDIFIIKFF